MRGKFPELSPEMRRAGVRRRAAITIGIASGILLLASILLIVDVAYLPSLILVGFGSAGIFTGMIGILTGGPRH
jgi:hypothetical protein